MRYAWLVTRDYLADELGDRTGTAGPRGATDVEVALAKTAGLTFRMADDDGEVIYAGRLWLEDEPGSAWTVETRQGNGGRWVCTSLPEEAFGPLDDLGRPDAGCTEIEFLTRDGHWAVL